MFFFRIPLQRERWRALGVYPAGTRVRCIYVPWQRLKFDPASKRFRSMDAEVNDLRLQWLQMNLGSNDAEEEGRRAIRIVLRSVCFVASFDIESNEKKSFET